MKEYNLVFAKHFVKSLKKIPLDYQKKKLLTIESLRFEPFLINAQKLTERDEYRIRFGIYRMLYKVEKVQIFIVKIAHRKDVYRK